MLQVVVAVGHHPKGLDLCLRNLRWAIRVPHRVTVLTLERYQLAPVGDESYLLLTEEECGDGDFFHLHQTFLPRVIADRGIQAVLLIQQDMLFHRPLDVMPRGITFTWAVGTKDFAVTDAEGQETYPRLWEGGVIYPINFLRAAQYAGVRFGFGYDWATDPRNARLVAGMCYRWKKDVRPVMDWIDHPPQPFLRGDNLSDLTLYAASWKAPTQTLDYVVHVSGAERAHRFLPDIYHDPEIPGRIARGEYVQPSDYQASNITFMMLLAEVVAPTPEMGQILRDCYSLANLHDVVAKIRLHGQEWMPPAQWERFAWACTWLK